MKYVLALLCSIVLIGCNDMQNMVVVPEPIEKANERSDGWLFTSTSIAPIEIQKGRTRYIKADDLFEFRNPFTISATSDNTDVALVTVQANQFLVHAIDIGETEITFTAKSVNGQLDTGVTVTVTAQSEE